MHQVVAKSIVPASSSPPQSCQRRSGKPPRRPRAPKPSPLGDPPALPGRLVEFDRSGIRPSLRTRNHAGKGGERDAWSACLRARCAMRLPNGA